MRLVQPAVSVRSTAGASRCRAVAGFTTFVEFGAAVGRHAVEVAGHPLVHGGRGFEEVVGEENFAPGKDVLCADATAIAQSIVACPWETFFVVLGGVLCADADIIVLGGVQGDLG